MVAIRHLFVLWCGADVAESFLARLPHFLSLTPYSLLLYGWCSTMQEVSGPQYRRALTARQT